MPTISAMAIKLPNDVQEKLQSLPKFLSPEAMGRVRSLAKRRITQLPRELYPWPRAGSPTADEFRQLCQQPD